MAKKTTPKFRPVANPEYIAAMRGLRGSSAASPQETREDRKRPRNVVKKQALSYGW